MMLQNEGAGSPHTDCLLEASVASLHLSLINWMFANEVKALNNYYSWLK